MNQVLTFILILNWSSLLLAFKPAHSVLDSDLVKLAQKEEFEAVGYIYDKEHKKMATVTLVHPRLEYAQYFSRGSRSPEFSNMGVTVAHFFAHVLLENKAEIEPKLAGQSVIVLNLSSHNIYVGFEGRFIENLETSTSVPVYQSKVVAVVIKSAYAKAVFVAGNKSVDTMINDIAFIKLEHVRIDRKSLPLSRELFETDKQLFHGIGIGYGGITKKAGVLLFPRRYECFSNSLEPGNFFRTLSKTSEPFYSNPTNLFFSPVSIPIKSNGSKVRKNLLSQMQLCHQGLNAQAIKNGYSGLPLGIPEPGDSGGPFLINSNGQFFIDGIIGGNHENPGEIELIRMSSVHELLSLGDRVHSQRLLLDDDSVIAQMFITIGGQPGDISFSSKSDFPLTQLKD